MTARALLWRILLAVPTTGLILLVLFVLVNLVPIVEPAGDADREMSSQQRRDGRRVFREQYGLDLPLLLNLRAGASAEDVDEADDDSVRALGRFGVIPLFAVASDAHRSTAARDRALALLPECAKVTIRLRDSRELQDEKLTDNRIVAQLEVPPAGLDEAGRASRLADWKKFIDAKKERFAPSGLSRIGIAFTETRLGVYLWNLAHLDFGRSLADGQAVWPVFVHRLSRSATLGFGYIAFSFAVALPLGLLMASLRRRGRARAASLALYAVYSLPGFFVGLLLQEWFAMGHPFDSFPLGGFRTNGPAFEEWGATLRGFDIAHHMMLPILALSPPTIVALARLLEGSLVDALRSDYVAAARAKGLSPRRVLFHHALRNALLPLATALGNMVPVIVGGAASIEFVFDIPGVGSYLLDAVIGNDFNVVLCITLLAALATQLGYLLSDLLYARLDPRIDSLGQSVSLRGRPA